MLVAVCSCRQSRTAHTIYIFEQAMTSSSEAFIGQSAQQQLATQTHAALTANTVPSSPSPLSRHCTQRDSDGDGKRQRRTMNDDNKRTKTNDDGNERQRTTAANCRTERTNENVSAVAHSRSVTHCDSYPLTHSPSSRASVSPPSVCLLFSITLFMRSTHVFIL